MRRNLAVAFVAAWIALGHAATARCGDLVFVNGGLGAGGPGIAGTLSLNVVRGETAYGLRTAGVSEFEIFGPSPSESATDFALLIGRASRSRHGLSYAMAGLGVVHSIRRGRMTQPAIWFVGPQHERIQRTTLGLPFEAGAILHAGVIGLGVSLFGDFNPAQSFLGVALNVQLGKMR